MKVLSWNVNSIRVRKDQLLSVIKKENPDIICLQETKTINDLFPKKTLEKKGYFVYVNGVQSYNGVAIISKFEANQISSHKFCNQNDARHIQANFKNFSIHSVYVPAGGDIADRDVNPKFGHKIDFVDEMKEWFSNNSPRKSVLVGDLNIAPLAEDVWSTRQLRNVVSHTDIEREKLTAVINEGGWVDAVREYYGPEKILYSWWSYRARDWKASNRGRRLDHIWLSADMKERVRDIDIMTQARGFEKPSDHVPMTIELAE